MNDRIRYLRWGAGSSTGPAHLKAGLPNQDAYATFASRDIVAAAVADGLGSRRFSHEGASWAATVAVALAVQHLHTDSLAVAPGQRLQELKAGILRAWRTHFGRSYADYDSTLLLVALTADRAIVAQIGDGLIVTRTSDGWCSTLPHSSKPFLNVTDSLAHRDALDVFRMRELVGPAREKLDALFLMTDGVADDLRDPPVFCAEAMELLRREKGPRWGETIRSWLKHWADSRHL